MKQYLVFDIGGTFVKYALMNENADILENDKIPTCKESAEGLLASMKVIADQYAGRFEGCAISMPGRIDTESGVAITAGALNRFLGGFAMGPEFSKLIQVPVVCANDGKCAAAAEAWQGALSDVENGFVVVFGTGLGGGIVIDHKAYFGTHFSSGEISGMVFDGKMMSDDYHAPSVYDPRRPSPGWAYYSSANALMRQYKEYLGLPFEAEVTGEEFFEKVRNGDEAANAVFDQFAEYTAVGFYNIQILFDVEKIAISGGISNAPELLPKLQESFHDLFKRMEHTPAVEPEIVKCRYGSEANLVGALKIYMDQVG